MSSIPAAAAEQLELIDQVVESLTLALGNAAPTSCDLLDALADCGIRLTVDVERVASQAYTVRIGQLAGRLPKLQVIA